MYADPIVGVYSSMELAKSAHPSLPEKSFCEREVIDGKHDFSGTRLIKGHYKLKLPFGCQTFCESKHMQILDGDFHDTNGELIDVTHELISEVRECLDKLAHSQFKVDMVWDAEYDYHYPAVINFSTEEFMAMPVYITDSFVDSLEGYLKINGIYFY